MNNLEPISQNYVPAAGRRGLTSSYDRMMAVTMRERTWRPATIDAVLANSPSDILEVGCGTGSNAIPIAAAMPEARVVGIDGDDEVLALAESKAAQADVAVEWVRGLAQDIPLHDASTDVVVMCLLLHHLLPADKRLALAEARRVLRPNGRLVVADWGKPRGLLASAGFYVVQLLDGAATTSEHRNFPLAEIISDAPFENVRTARYWTTPWGSLELCVADAPDVAKSL